MNIHQHPAQLPRMPRVILLLLADVDEPYGEPVPVVRVVPAAAPQPVPVELPGPGAPAAPAAGQLALPARPAHGMHHAS